MSPRLLFVVGASGAGKTTAVRSLEQRRLHAVRCHYFDSIGVPSPEEMQRRWGSGERWQEDATRRWIEQLAAEPDPSAVSVLDGQTRPSFIRKHIASAGPAHRIVLLDCDPATRVTRLRDGRSQPELATARMDNWAAYLRGEANALGLPVIDTSRLAVDAVVDALLHEVELLAKEGAMFRRGAPYFPVADVAQTGAYYHDVLGFQLEYAGGNPPEFAVYSRDGCPLMLRRVADPSRIQPNEARGGTWDAFFWVREVDALFRELEGKGATFAYRPIVQPYGMKEFAARDPHGYVLGFGQAVQGVS